MAYGLVLAGGIGKRMGSEIPKQYLRIHGKAIISYTVKEFIENPNIEKVLVLVPEDWINYTNGIFDSDFGLEEKLLVIQGGELRNDTIMNGIKYIKEHFDYDDNTVVVTHDAVRPFVTQRIINDNIAALEKYTACDTVVPATDTIVESMSHEIISDIPNRANLYQGQTPQSFRLTKFEERYNSLTEEEKEILTDAAKVFVIKGEDVGLVEGDGSNIKVTYPSDLDLARSLLGIRERAQD